jgi:hypothetical protein
MDAYTHEVESVQKISYRLFIVFGMHGTVDSSKFGSWEHL